ncbi:esterase [Pseudopedobacter saltans DSM 12145]|uniref:Esterase n=1 Tax=Pseudopedobacter saltans (strain ATCC 51119 / DSM 12145 / JCM 21818 / CCUG 39354 / LMG 10337 / NBRC 100064 / NCIMB 13643) TaxID=762903 RepID=F0SC16_PSESL|nr:alpha/beta hydrolase-fold protein [Pseudopedobacter saltans]ADY50601.1 esterase [Pseudopedobacter saltans DSM 12145]
MKSKILLFIISFLFQTAFSQDLLVVESKFLNANDSVHIYKPINYSQIQKIPVVYLLHGHSANYKSWGKLVDLQQLANQFNFLIVCPDGQKKSWYINSLKVENSQYESFFIKELLPKINKEYAVNEKQVFITGASMGGYGALRMLCVYPDIFLSAGSTSGVVNLKHSSFKKTTLAEHLGDFSEDNHLFDEYSISYILPKLSKDKTFVFDCGTEDYLYKANKDLRDRCDELKLKVTYTAKPGAHTGSYWAESLPSHFWFFTKLLNK